MCGGGIKSNDIKFGLLNVSLLLAVLLRVFKQQKRPTLLSPPRPLGFKRNFNAPQARQIQLKWESLLDESFKYK
jgi:hypothetical protein